MTQHEKLEKSMLDQVFADATTNALLYGMGLVRISMVQGGRIEVSCVDRDEFMEVAGNLEWIDQNCAKELKQ